MAQEIGYSRGNLQRVFIGYHIPSYSMLEDMVLYLHVNPGWLFGTSSQVLSDRSKARGTRAEISGRIKELRSERNMTQSAFADFTGLSRSAILLGENGKRDLSEESLMRIASACNVGFYWLFSGDVKSKENPCNQEMVSILNRNEKLRKAIREGKVPEHFQREETEQPTHQIADPKEVGKRIHKLREDNNCTLVQVADMADISKSAISVWESGKSLPDGFTLRRLAETLDVSVDWILYGDVDSKYFPCDHRMIEYLNEHPEIRSALV